MDLYRLAGGVRQQSGSPVHPPIRREHEAALLRPQERLLQFPARYLRELREPRSLRSAANPFPGAQPFPHAPPLGMFRLPSLSSDRQHFFWLAFACDFTIGKPTCPIQSNQLLDFLSHL